MDIYRQTLRLAPYKRPILAGGFLLGFALVAGLLAVSAALIAKSRMTDHEISQVSSLGQATSKWLTTFEALAELDEAEACSPQFIAGLREIAFLPDGVHELIYARGDSIACSVTLGKAEKVIRIGPADASLRGGEMDIWFDRDLDMLALPDLSGSFLRLGNFMLVVSEPDLAATPAAWMGQSLSYLTTEGKVATDAGAGSAAHGGWRFSQSACDANGIYCIDVDAQVAEIAAAEWPSILGSVLIAALCGLAGCQVLNGWLNRLWAFPTRFRKLIDEESLVCNYQPILACAENRTGGIEVLARWRDSNGEIVYPDKFLPVVQAHGMTRAFTEIVVRRVYRDLLALPDHGAPLRVHFNIFPPDFDANWLLDVFSPILLMADRFVVVAEIVESECLPLEETRETVEMLRNHGILTYIDDFGAGYTNIQYLAHLSVDGVKLDRAFGQAPDGSLMAGLLLSAAEMIKGAGFPLVVEGVETAERLDYLRDSGLFDQAQGYHISRPLGYGGLVDYLRKEQRRPPRTGKRPLLRAM